MDQGVRVDQGLRGRLERSAFGLEPGRQGRRRRRALLPWVESASHARSFGYPAQGM